MIAKSLNIDRYKVLDNVEFDFIKEKLKDNNAKYPVDKAKDSEKKYSEL